MRIPIQIDPARDLVISCDAPDYFTAMFKREPYSVLGCPMGRGTTKDAALTDLKRRVEIESPVSITFLVRGI